MTLISSQTLNSFAFIWFIVGFCLLGSLDGYSQSPGSSIESPQVVPLHELEVKGAERTNLAWIRHYLGLAFPLTLSREEVAGIADKLRTTGVFTSVQVRIIPSWQGPRRNILQIQLEEKWTTIPVVRGAYGGGTPLTVIGVYDTHVLGKLWTLGMEGRKYGSAPTGGAIWARAPRWLNGHHMLSLELWQDNRIRAIYDEKDAELGSFDSRAKMARIQFMAPFLSNLSARDRGSWQYGFDFKFRSLEPTVYKPNEKASIKTPPERVIYNEVEAQEVWGLGKVTYDDLLEDQLNMDGTRLVASLGPIFRQDKETTTLAEVEGFYFHLFPDDYNLALHFLAGSSSNPSVHSIYFLGGFDSIRGIPDGAVYGDKAVYANAEIRKLVSRSKYLWTQAAVFSDWGSAASEWKDMPKEDRSSVGLGFRFAVPQVYRLTFRIDYAWSLDDPKTRGITAGMNQFFQPYKPL